jgi:cytochrome P450
MTREGIETSRGEGMAERPIIDFDHHSQEFAHDWDSLKILGDLRGKCPVAWTPANGGHWVLTRYDDIATVARNDEVFSSFNDVEGGGKNGTGILIPQGVVRMGIIEQDPPICRDLRKLVMKWFLPGAIDELKPYMNEVMVGVIDSFIQEGECDLVKDLCARVPAAVTMKLIGLDVAHADRYASTFHRNMYVRHDATNPEEYEKLVADLMFVRENVVAAVADRRNSPRENEVISDLCQATIDGEPLSDEQVIDVVFTFLGGGFDTTTSLTANTLYWLGRRPEVSQQLIDNPQIMDSATEEFLRHFAPILALARTAKEETVIGGQAIKPGERLLLSWAAANHDPTQFERPDDVVLDRFPNRHMTFGMGAHRCVGANLARAEFQAMISHTLRRLPDFKIDYDRVEPYPDVGLSHGYIKMPATFTPGPKVGCGN